jgi:hypothetical protein
VGSRDAMELGPTVDVLWGALRRHQEEMTVAGVPPSVVHWTSVLAAWVNTADMEQASRVLTWMQVTVALLFACQRAIVEVIPQPPTTQRAEMIVWAA